jgi:hypothetical protein
VERPADQGEEKRIQVGRVVPEQDSRALKFAHRRVGVGLEPQQEPGNTGATDPEPIPEAGGHTTDLLFCRFPSALVYVSAMTNLRFGFRWKERKP